MLLVKTWHIILFKKESFELFSQTTEEEDSSVILRKLRISFFPGNGENFLFADDQ